MVKIYIESFITRHPDESWSDVMENISDYCHSVSTDVGIYSHYDDMYICDKSLIFPNVVYIEYLHIPQDVYHLGVIFPDLTKVGLFSGYGYIFSFGKIKEIDELDFKSINMPRKSLGNDMYRFANNETGEDWDIKINNFK